ncbi:hypothetical protein GQ42DRAFT_50637 [Ramicandelaber brevisporus]|nr:hypothetical protein GQ42DRAFT_50637 [Ramicandelaber brevisporus]
MNGTLSLARSLARPPACLPAYLPDCASIPDRSFVRPLLMVDWTGVKRATVSTFSLSVSSHLQNSLLFSLLSLIGCNYFLIDNQWSIKWSLKYVLVFRPCVQCQRDHPKHQPHRNCPPRVELHCIAPLHLHHHSHRKLCLSYKTPPTAFFAT